MTGPDKRRFVFIVLQEVQSDTNAHKYFGDVGDVQPISEEPPKETIDQHIENELEALKNKPAEPKEEIDKEKRSK